MATLNVNIRIKNARQVSRAFKLAPKIINQELDKAIRKSTLLIHGESAKRTPVDTGRLRASHGTRFSGTGLRFKGEVSTNTNYDRFVHDGTKFMRARPFMREAVEANSDKIEKIISDHLQLALNKATRNL